MLLSRAEAIIEVLSSEIKKHQRALEQDDAICKINFEVILGRRSGRPVKVRFLTSSESDLTEVER